MRQVESIADRIPKSARTVRAEDIAAEIERQMGDLAIDALYRKRILSQRTRQYELKAGIKSSPVEVLHTLLGIELKIANRRLLCPDLATARYLSVFARAGVSEVAVPYDITKISSLADELESAWQRMLLLCEHLTRGRAAAFRTRVRTSVVKEAKREIEEAGAGTAVPQFRQTTRQRPQSI
jgi:hypothetical protein